MRLSPVLALLTACTLSLVACDSEPPSPPPPSGTDAGTEPGADAGTDAGTEPQAPRTSVTSAQPAEGSQGLYPVELYYDGAASRPGVYLRKVLSVTFTGPMEPSLAQVTLSNRTDTSIEPRPLTGQWSSDRRTLTVTVPAPEEGGPPLEASSLYALDLTQLKDATGYPLDGTPVLGDGKLDFTTGAREALLEHSCTHALVNTATALDAAPTPFAFPPATDTGHTRYRLTLPASEGSFQGYSELISAPDVDETVTLFLDRRVPLSVRNDTEGMDVPVELLPTEPACAGITHRARFSATAGDLIYQLRYGPTDFATFEFVLERQTK